MHRGIWTALPRGACRTAIWVAIGCSWSGGGREGGREGGGEGGREHASLPTLTKYYQFFFFSNILDPSYWKFMVCAVGCLNIVAYGPHKP